MKYLIEVTQEDIDKKGKLGGACPVALAAKRVFGERFKWVPMYSIELKDKVLSLPEEAFLWIRNYDCGDEMKPITFEVEEKDGVE